MPTYECNEHQFIENLRRLLDSHIRVILNRAMIQYDDSRYSLSFIPDEVFKKYYTISRRRKVRESTYATKPFLDEYHHTLHLKDDCLSSRKQNRMRPLSIPYIRVEYSFSIWGDTYKHSFDVLLEPGIRIAKRKLPKSRLRYSSLKDKMLIHTLQFNLPDEKGLSLILPKSVIVFEIRRMIRG